MMEELISVIVPVYNVEQFLKRAIESVLNQTYKNIELILIDDGSTDSSGQICDSYSKRYQNIRVIHKCNEGVSVARNVGLEKAKGEYIAFLDSDDYMNLDMIEKMFTMIKKQHSDVVCCCYHLINEEGKEIDYTSIPLENTKLEGIEAYGRLIESSCYTTVIWNKLFTKNIIGVGESQEKFEKGLTVGEDELWLIKILIAHNATVSFMTEQLYNWVQRQGSALHSGENITIQRLDEFEVRKIVYSMCKETGNTNMINASGALLYDKAFALYRTAIKKGEGNLCREIKPILKETYTKWIGRRETSTYEKVRNLFWQLRLWSGIYK